MSPLPFVLYVNGINKVLKHCRFSLVADDIKSFLQIDSILLQEDLEAIYGVLGYSGIGLNISKCRDIYSLL